MLLVREVQAQLIQELTYPEPALIYPLYPIPLKPVKKGRGKR